MIYRPTSYNSIGLRKITNARAAWETAEMASYEEEKKNWELGQGHLVAMEINKVEGSDYEAHPSDQEPADLILRSKSKARPDLPVQVVSIPVDFRHRDDKHTVEKVRAALFGKLVAAGVKHCLVGIILSGDAEMHGIKAATMDALGELILHAASAGRNQALDYGDIYERSPEIAEQVHTVLISYHECVPSVEIDVPAGSALPPDGRWISEGILKKAAKYGGERAVRDLALLIGVKGFVDDEQIQAFQAAHPAETLPFAQVWIVTPFHGVIRLKP
jgi:hypothetical protein